jgi:hypothetical protein
VRNGGRGCSVGSLEDLLSMMTRLCMYLTNSCEFKMQVYGVARKLWATKGEEQEAAKKEFLEIYKT